MHPRNKSGAMKSTFRMFLITVIVSCSLVFPQSRAHAMLGNSREGLVISLTGLIIALEGLAGTLDALGNNPNNLNESLIWVVVGVIILDQSNEKIVPKFLPITQDKASTAKLTTKEFLAYNQSIEELNALSEDVNLEFNHNKELTESDATLYWKEAFKKLDSNVKIAVQKLLVSRPLSD